MGNPLVRFCEGQEYNCEYGRDIVAPLWKQAVTENTNVDLRSGESPVYSKNAGASLE